MFSFKLKQLLFFTFFYGYDFHRRIQGGQIVNEAKPKNYVVYLLKAAISPQTYDSWLCGGAIVTRSYIVTSAACVADVQHLYAIAGYKTYVKDTKIYDDLCTKNNKKKIIYICTPLHYELVYTKQEKWSNIDIAVVQVDMPYDFTIQNTECSYAPGKIDINYEAKYQMPGTDAIVLGWGHDTLYRQENDFTDYNQPQLKYASTLIEDKETCKQEYEIYPGMDVVIDNYMICTMEKGNLDDVGVTILKGTHVDGCKPQNSKLLLQGELPCDNTDNAKNAENADNAKNADNAENVDNADIPEDHIVLIENARKDIKLNFSRNDSDQKSHNSSLINKMNKTISNSRRSNTRRNGICQNDHGGPLVTWVGAHEMLIGVASAYKLTENSECTGPFLYTSTQCNGLFLDCILQLVPIKSTEDRRRICNELLNKQGLKLVEKHISWADHPDGPAENEKNGTTPVSAVNDTNSVSQNFTNQTPKVPPSENDKNGTTPVTAVNDTNSVSKNDTKTTPKVTPAENDKNGTTPVTAVNDTNSVSKNDTKTTPKVTPAENDKNGTTPVTAVNDTNSVSKNDTKTTPKVTPAENDKNGTTPVTAVNDTNSVSKKDTKTTPKVTPAENDKNGTTPVTAVNDTNSVSKNDTKTTPKVLPAVNEKNVTTPVSAVNDTDSVSNNDTKRNQ